MLVIGESRCEVGGNSPYYLLNFSVNLKLLLLKSVFKKNSSMVNIWSGFVSLLQKPHCLPSQAGARSDPAGLGLFYRELKQGVSWSRHQDNPARDQVALGSQEKTWIWSQNVVWARMMRGGRWLWVRKARQPAWGRSQGPGWWLRREAAWKTMGCRKGWPRPLWVNREKRKRGKGRTIISHWVVLPAFSHF